MKDVNFKFSGEETWGTQLLLLQRNKFPNKNAKGNPLIGLIYSCLYFSIQNDFAVCLVLDRGK